MCACMHVCVCVCVCAGVCVVCVRTISPASEGGGIKSISMDVADVVAGCSEETEGVQFCCSSIFSFSTFS